MTSKPDRYFERNAGDLWAITSYFNPMAYRRRLDNYAVFREHLKLPLAAVELAYGPEYELKEKDAEILVQWYRHSLAERALAEFSTTDPAAQLQKGGMDRL